MERTELAGCLVAAEHLAPPARTSARRAFSGSRVDLGDDDSRGGDEPLFFPSGDGRLHEARPDGKRRLRRRTDRAARCRRSRPIPPREAPANSLRTRRPGYRSSCPSFPRSGRRDPARGSRGRCPLRPRSPSCRSRDRCSRRTRLFGSAPRSRRGSSRPHPGWR